MIKFNTSESGLAFIFQASITGAQSAGVRSPCERQELPLKERTTTACRKPLRELLLCWLLRSLISGGECCGHQVFRVIREEWYL